MVSACHACSRPRSARSIRPHRAAPPGVPGRRCPGQRRCCGHGPYAVRQPRRAWCTLPRRPVLDRDRRHSQGIQAWRQRPQGRLTALARGGPSSPVAQRKATLLEIPDRAAGRIRPHGTRRSPRSRARAGRDGRNKPRQPTAAGRGGTVGMTSQVRARYRRRSGAGSTLNARASGRAEHRGGSWHAAA
jgi:hypothetical protein